MAVGSMTVMGDKELAKALKMLGSAKVVRALSRKAIVAANAPIRKAMKAKAPKDKGNLKKSIVSKVRTYPNGNVVGITGPRNQLFMDNEGRWINPSRYAHIVEYGAAPHLIRRVTIDGTFYPVVQHPGAPAQPFMRPAWAGSKGAAFNAARRKYATEIAKEAKKARRQGGSK